MTHYNLVHKFIPMLQALIIRDGKAAMDKEWKKLETISAWQLDKVKIKKRLFWRHRMRKRKSTVFTLMGHLSSQKCWVKKPQFQKCKGRVVLRGDSVKDDSGAYAVCTASLVCVSNDRSKSNGHYIKASRMFRTSSWCSIRLYSGKDGGCSKIAQNSQVGISRFMDTSSTTHLAPNHGQTLKIQWFFLNEIYTDIHLVASCVERQICESSTGTRIGKSAELGMHILFLENKDYVCQYSWMTSTWLERSRIWLPCGRKWWKIDLDEPTSFLDHVYLGCTQRERKDIRITYFCWSNWKLQGGKGSKTVAWSYDMEGHARKCVERYCELANKKDRAAARSLQLLAWMNHHFKKEELESVGELSKLCAHSVFKKLVFGTNWLTWTFFGQ